MDYMRICCISDTHTLQGNIKLPDCDIMVHTGDMMNKGQDLRELLGFANWLNKEQDRLGFTAVITPGNHDLLFDSEFREIAKTTISGKDKYYLENSGVTIDGLNFWGSPVQPWFHDWAFNVPRGAEIKKYWDLIPEDTDILMTHGPAWGILDTSTAQGDHLGCEELRIQLENRAHPKLHVFGHIHGGYGVSTELPNTISINASVCTEAYRPTNPIQAVLLDNKKPVLITYHDPKTAEEISHVTP